VYPSFHNFRHEANFASFSTKVHARWRGINMPWAWRNLVMRCLTVSIASPTLPAISTALNP
jgi:hypothetical protein